MDKDYTIIDGYKVVPEFKFTFTSKLLEFCKKTGKDPNEWLPTKSHDLDTGWDVRCAAYSQITLANGWYTKVPLGFRVLSPYGWWLKLVPRSSTFIKKNIHALYGVIDETYENEVAFCGQFIYDIKTKDFGVSSISFGERIGQLIPVRREEMIVKRVSSDEFDQLCAIREAGRGGGFGSTG